MEHLEGKKWEKFRQSLKCEYMHTLIPSVVLKIIYDDWNKTIPPHVPKTMIFKSGRVKGWNGSELYMFDSKCRILDTYGYCCTQSNCYENYTKDLFKKYNQIKMELKMFNNAQEGKRNRRWETTESQKINTKWQT